MINVITAMISKVLSPCSINKNSHLGAGRMTAISELSHSSSGNLRDFLKAVQRERNKYELSLIFFFWGGGGHKFFVMLADFPVQA